VVTPSKSLFLCRPSGATGSSIDMVLHAMPGLSESDAAAFILERDKPEAGGQKPAAVREKEARERDERKAAAEAKREAEARQEAAKRRQDEEAIAGVLERCIPIEGTHAEAYLALRGLKPPRRICGDLRFVPDLDYWGHESPQSTVKAHIATLPAMVAMIRDVEGSLIGIHQTYLDPGEPIKWVAEFEREIDPKKRVNKAKKIRGEKKRGLIRLGMIEESLAIAEGIENALAWFSLGIGPENVSLATSVDLHNMAGGWTGTLDHPTRKTADGRPTKYPNAIFDPAAPGMILPDSVREVILIGDGDSERYATRGAVQTGARRLRAEGKTVFVHFAPEGMDWNDLVRANARTPHAI
jgi:hypothetical protein